MYPILAQFGDFILPTWHVFYMVGAVAAYYLMGYLYRTIHPERVRESDLNNIYLIAYFIGYLGARFGAIITEEGATVENLLGLLRFGSMMMYGGAIGGAIGAASFILWRRLPLRPLLDILVPSFLLAIAIGRIGCFLNGDDFGRAIALSPDQSPPFWAVTFPVLNDQIFRYPVQLLESAIVFIIVAIGITLAKRRSIPAGFVGISCAAGYCIARFFLEMLRGDPRGQFLYGVFSPSQVVSVALLIFLRVLAGRFVIQAIK